MKKAALTVISYSELSLAAVLMDSVEQLLPDFDRKIYILDWERFADPKNIPEEYAHLPLEPASKLWGDEFQNRAFFHTKEEFREVTTVAAMRLMLHTYDAVAYFAPQTVFHKRIPRLETALGPGRIAFVQTPAPYRDMYPMDKFLRSDYSLSLPGFYVFCAGGDVTRFLVWAQHKFDYMYQTGISSSIRMFNSVHGPNMPDPAQLDFYKYWPEYGSALGVSLTRLTIPFVASPYNDGYVSPDPVFGIYTDLKKLPDFKDTNPTLQEKIIQYLKQVKSYPQLASEYGFDVFDDGTSVFMPLHYYYAKNYRLRHRCKNAPFSKRSAFTDETVIPGQLEGAPLTAAAEAIWFMRKDLQKVFPNPRTHSRMAYIEWYLAYGQEEYDELEDIYFTKVRELFEREKETFAIEQEKQRVLHEKDVEAARAEAAKIDAAQLANATAKAIAERPMPNAVYRGFRKLGMVKDFDPVQIVVPAHPTEEILASIQEQRVEKNELDPNLEKGVNLAGNIRGSFGIAEGSRILASILQASNIPFGIVDMAYSEPSSYNVDTWSHKITNRFDYNINLMYTNAEAKQDLYDDVDAAAFKGHFNIGYWAWELNEFPEGWIPAFEGLDELWTLSQFAADALQKVSPVPVLSFPHSVVVRGFDDSLTKKSLGLPEDTFVFLMMFDVRSLTERKNPMGAVNAFIKAFEGRDDVSLLIKINAPPNWSVRSDIELFKKLTQYKNIYTLQRGLSREQTNSLLNLCDAYLSLHRAEGFGLGPAEAMYLGKPAVLTNWSGNTEYMRPDSCCPVKYEIVEIDKSYGPYKKGWHWAEPDIEDAAIQMRRLVDDPEWYSKIASNGQKVIREEFSPEYIGKQVRKRLETLGLL